MTTTTTFQGMEPGAKNSSRVLRPPGGGSNITLGADEEKPPVRKNKMASSVFAEPEDPYANRRNNPPGGKPTGVLCGEPSAPLRRGVNQGINHTGEAFGNVRSWSSGFMGNTEMKLGSETDVGGRCISLSHFRMRMFFSHCHVASWLFHYNFAKK
uniref:Jupiter microtubule associated homolog 1a n=1 Tax=Oryzias melastigma TaxID=30732 RepID=A0A3B3CG06_ORYME